MFRLYFSLSNDEVLHSEFFDIVELLFFLCDEAFDFLWKFFSLLNVGLVDGGNGIMIKLKIQKQWFIKVGFLFLLK